MPYQEHPSCDTPKDLTQKIWRYMDFTKFVSILEESALYFSGLSELSEFDRFEGFLSTPTVQKFRTVPDGINPQEAQRRIEVGEHNLGFQKWSRNLVYVSSWHMNEHESAAMWKLYLKSGEGVAIQSTIGKMIQSFQNTEESVHIGMVEYIDYEKDEMPWDNVFSLAMFKRKSFAHEKELRAIIMEGGNGKSRYLKMELNNLIEKIYIAPSSPIWICNLIKKVIIKYGLNKEVVNSSLDQTPLY